MSKLDYLIKGELPAEKPIRNTAGIPIHSLLDGNYCSPDKLVYLATVTATADSMPGLKRKLLVPEVSPYLLRLAGFDREKICVEDLLFIDTETTGLSGGTGTLAFMVGLGFFAAGEFIIEHYFLTDPAGEPELVRILTEKFRQFTALVSFNGKSYDLPLLETRWIIQGADFNPRTLPHLDLLPLSRRFWGRTLPGCSLGQLEAYILHSGRNPATDVPGSKIPQLYFEYLQTREFAPLINVFYHNRFDMVSMVLLLTLISRALDKPHTLTADDRVFLPGVARLLADMGALESARVLYSACIEQGIAVSQSTRELSFLYKRCGRRAESRRLWETAVLNNKTYACIELAKLAEHREKEYRRACELTGKALAIENGLSPVNSKLVAELRHRLQRLVHKLERRRD